MTATQAPARNVMAKLAPGSPDWTLADPDAKPGVQHGTRIVLLYAVPPEVTAAEAILRLNQTTVAAQRIHVFGWHELGTGQIITD